MISSSSRPIFQIRIDLIIARFKLASLRLKIEARESIESIVTKDTKSLP